MSHEKELTTSLRLLTHAGTGTLKTFVGYGKILIIVPKNFSQGNHHRYCEGMLAALFSVIFGWSDHPLTRYLYRDWDCCLMQGRTLCPVVCLWNVLPSALLLLEIHIEYYYKIVSTTMLTSHCSLLKVFSFLPDRLSPHLGWPLWQAMQKQGSHRSFSL